MYIDASECEAMHHLVSMTLRGTKVTPGALECINTSISNLQTFVLDEVSGISSVYRCVRKFSEMKVLSLGLSSPAQFVSMDAPSLEKLELKMLCPVEIRIVAPQLKSLAFNMKVSEQSSLRVCSEDTCEEHATKVMPGGLLEILYGASSFEILAILIARNMRTLKKLCWDIPCMELNEDGTFCKVLTDVPLNLPSFEHLHNCERLQSLYIGPGLWYSMETHVNQLAARNRWPRMHTLVVHMIPHDTGSSIRVLQMILGPSVKHLTIYIHKSGPVDSMLIKQRIKESDMQGIDCIVKECSTSHDFTYFSF
nr:uncharacterized protein LOC112274096 isoform X1 [Physcomitrium patens]|eukprot:XP_024359027.1 uncharacterized protein LOC112274096 isoform X1 [Physcomitrella patens]